MKVRRGRDFHKSLEPLPQESKLISNERGHSWQIETRLRETVRPFNFACPKPCEDHQETQGGFGNLNLGLF